VDRGALDAALAAGFCCGGWCPEGRLAEDGVIPKQYPLRELSGGGYENRTVENVRDSDGTLIIHFGSVTGGTRLTVAACGALGRPHLVVDGAQLSPERVGEQAAAFVRSGDVAVLNVAGPRESGAPGATKFARLAVAALLQAACSARCRGLQVCAVKSARSRSSRAQSS
jgi:hypothetical protein